MTTPRDIVRRISQEAKRQGQTFELDREGANHTVWLLNGSTMIPIPRHREVGEQLAEKIYKEFQDILGEGLVAIMSEVTAKATRDGDHWLVHVPEVERWTQARALAEIEPMARDLVAIITGEAADAIAVVVEVELPASVRAHLEEVERARESEAAARSRAAAELRTAVRELRDARISLREIGKLLGISHQRVSQLAGPVPGTGRRLAG